MDNKDNSTGDLEKGQESSSRRANVTTGNLAATAPPRRTSHRDGQLQGHFVDIAAATQLHGAFKAAMTVGVRTNGFSQNTFPSQVWEQETKQQKANAKK